MVSPSGFAIFASMSTVIFGMQNLVMNFMLLCILIYITQGEERSAVSIRYEFQNFGPKRVVLSTNCKAAARPASNIFATQSEICAKCSRKVAAPGWLRFFACSFERQQMLEKGRHVRVLYPWSKPARRHTLFLPLRSAVGSSLSAWLQRWKSIDTTKYHAKMDGTPFQQEAFCTTSANGQGMFFWFFCECKQITRKDQFLYL